MRKGTDYFKAYYLTCSLLSQFEGIHAMMAEEELFYWCLDLVEGKMEKKYFLEEIEFLFGLKKRNLTKALREYEKYRKEELDIEGQHLTE